MKLVFELCPTAIVAGILLLVPPCKYSQHSPVLAATPPRSPVGEICRSNAGGKRKRYYCGEMSGCHSVARIVISHRSKDEWESVVGQMIEGGAPITLEELPIVADYLAANFGRAGSDASTAATVATATSEASRIVDPDQAQFSAVADSMGLPSGAQMSIVSGDPSKTGVFSMMVKIPAGAVIPPHWFLGDENFVCLRGTIQIGEGGEFLMRES